jgi:hypothetical protein
VEKGKELAIKKKDTDEEPFNDDTKFTVDLLKRALNKI